jgi:hypothetical protein
MLPDHPEVGDQSLVVDPLETSWNRKGETFTMEGKVDIFGGDQTIEIPVSGILLMTGSLCSELMLRICRYEREVNLAQRSAIKRLQEQDSPASLPMVLCVTSITQTFGTTEQSDAAKTPNSCLELTDGWYHIRANVDPPLQRAIDTGKLLPGFKIAIAGARVSKDIPY